jgi:hypothetical protein
VHELTKTQLITFRLLAPGLIVIQCTLPYWFGALDSIRDLLPWLVTLTAPVLGAVYYALDIRRHMWTGFEDKCHRNVRAKMIQPFATESAGQDTECKLTDSDVMRLFYHILDQDESLKDQAEAVRLNGAVLSTIVDAISIYALFTAVYFVTFVWTRNPLFGWLTIVSGVLQGLFAICEAKVVKKHLVLEDRQLAVIRQFHADKVQANIKKHKAGAPA